MPSGDLHEAPVRVLGRGPLDAHADLSPSPLPLPLAPPTPLRDKAGGYGIQALGGMLVEAIHGDFLNVVGFPLNRFCKKLSELYRPPRPEDLQRQKHDSIPAVDTFEDLSDVEGAGPGQGGAQGAGGRPQARGREAATDADRKPTVASVPPDAVVALIDGYKVSKVTAEGGWAGGGTRGHSWGGKQQQESTLIPPWRPDETHVSCGHAPSSGSRAPLPRFPPLPAPGAAGRISLLSASVCLHVASPLALCLPRTPPRGAGPP